MDTLIITINDRRNYGNRLQNWALSRVLSGLGRCSTASTMLDGDLARGGRGRLADAVRSLRDRLLAGSPGHAAAVRAAGVAAFDRRHGLRGPALTRAGGLEGAVPDAVVIGSDQVWNAMWASPSDLELRLGMNFDGARVVAYAASVGTEAVPDWSAPAFREGLRRMAAVSVREDRAAEICREVAGVEAEVVLDPALLVDIDAWRGVFPGAAPAGGAPYACEYFLGEPDAADRAAMDAWERGRRLAVRRPGAPGDPSLGMGPGALAELVAGAEAVFTDSYHGCLLALLFGRPVACLPRRGLPAGLDMSSRGRTLDRLLGLGGALLSGGPEPVRFGPAVAGAIADERERSLAWLRSALTGVERSLP